MKRLALPIALVIFLYCYSCFKKEDANSDTLFLLQHKWKLDSTLYFPNTSFRGRGRKEVCLNEVIEFRKDSMGLSRSQFIKDTQESHDSLYYKLLNDNTILILGYNSFFDKIKTEKVYSTISLLTDNQMIMKTSQKDYDSGDSIYKIEYFHR